MRPLRLSDHHVPFLPQSPLPKVPGQCTREVAPEAAPGAAAGRVLSHRLQCPPSPDPVDVAEQETALLPPVSGYGCHASGRGLRPEASRRRNRLPLHPAYLGTDLEPASAYPLRGARRRPVPGSHPLDFLPSPFLSAGEGPQQHFSPEVPGGIESSLFRK